ncbi:protein c-Fos-like [Glandiceps talaboti]
MDTGEKKASKSAMLVVESEEDRQLRREKNRLAAMKCRHKKKERIETLLKEVDKLTAKNSELQRIVERLKGEEEELTIVLQSHLVNCRLSTDRHEVSHSYLQYRY